MLNKVVRRGRWRSFALFLSLSGCTSLSDCKYEMGQKIRTGQAWHEFDGCNEQCFTLDYRDGWKQGYYDVLTGGDGRPPVVPPKKYWKPPVFTEHDPSRQNDWFIGYQDGASCAKSQPDFHYVPTFMAPAMHQSYFGHDSVDAVSSEEHSTDGNSQEPMPEMMEDGTAPGVEAAPMQDPSGTPATNPEAAPAAPKPDEYEKDPEASSTYYEAAEPSATDEIVSGYRKPNTTFLDQLVRNASATTVQP